MSLNNVVVFNKYLYTTLNELVAQQIELFNAATRGAIILRNEAFEGDYSDTTFWQFLSGMVRRRNAYGSGAVSAVTMQMLVDSMVKVAAGTPPINIPPSMFSWIGQNPEQGGINVARQLAPAMMTDMLNTAVSALAAGLRNVSDVNINVSGNAGQLAQFNPGTLNQAKALFGDRSSQIAAWVVHSKPMHDYFGNAIANAAQLYTYETIAVTTDPFGALFVMSDIPALRIAGSPDNYINLGLVPGAVVVARNNDFVDNFDTTNGDENLRRTYQAEWTYNLGVKGMSWDKTNGGRSPTSAALAVGTNWDRTATSIKDLGGVVLRTL
jgi:hypothetical protein